MAQPFLYGWRDAILSPDCPLTSTQRFVAIAVSQHMNRNGGSCYPSIERIAAETALGRSTVIDALKAIETAGYLHVKHGGKGRARFNKYTATNPIENVQQPDVSAEKNVQLTPRKRPADTRKTSSSWTRGLQEDSRGRANGARDPESRAPLAPEDDCANCFRKRPLIGPTYLYCTDCIQERRLPAEAGR